MATGRYETVALDSKRPPGTVIAPNEFVRIVQVGKLEISGIPMKLHQGEILTQLHAQGHVSQEY
jgi:hypothetical protein